MHFVSIDHVYCSRHILENVQRHLTDGGIDVKTRQQIVNLVNRCSDVSCDSSSASDNAVDQLMESVRLQARDSHTDYKVKRSRSRGGGILWRPPSRTACLTCLSFSHMIFLYLCLLMFDNFVCDSATVYFFNMSFIHMIFLYLCLLMFDF